MLLPHDYDSDVRDGPATGLDAVVGELVSLVLPVVSALHPPSSETYSLLSAHLLLLTSLGRLAYCGPGAQASLMATVMTRTSACPQE